MHRRVRLGLDLKDSGEEKTRSYTMNKVQKKLHKVSSGLPPKSELIVESQD